MTANGATDLIERLQARIHEVVGPLVSGGAFALVDFPDHSNVGDSAIWLGEIAYLTRYHSLPSYVSTSHDFAGDVMKRAVEHGPILIHGGGNFGDIWNHHQRFREMILEKHRDRPVVQLPQSIHYRSADRLAQTARLIAAHPNFTLLVRDEESLALAQKHFDCRTELVPDMAFCLGPQDRGPPHDDVLAMLRTDSEAAGIGEGGRNGLRVEDWLDEDVGSVRKAKVVGMARSALSLRLGGLREARFTAAARHRLDRGLRQLAGARVIVTDRLHCHILALLLGRPHAVLDNSYGKIGRFMAAFSGGTDLSYRASSLADAVEWARARAAAGKLEKAA